MCKRYAPVILICLWTFAHASDEVVASQVKSTQTEPAGHPFKKPKKVITRASTNGECEYTGNSKEDVACSYDKYQVVEVRLSSRYEQLLVELDTITQKQPVRLADLKPKLIAAQQAWIKYRETQCRAVEVWYKNGKLMDALYTDCMRSLGEKRIEELNSFTGNQT